MTDQPRLSDRLERSLSLSANRSEYTTEGAAIVLSNAIRGSISELQALEARVEEVEAENERLREARGWVGSRAEWNDRNEFEPNIFEEWKAYSASEKGGEWPVETAEQFEGVYAWIVSRLAEARQETTR